MTKPTAKDTATPDLSELDLLKLRAKQLGIEFHHAIGAVKLSKMIEAELNPTTEAPTGQNVPMATRTSKNKMRVAQSKSANRLVRIRVSNLNPAKKEWPGEVYTVANSVVGSIRKYVPFNNDRGWHVPQMMLNMMQEKECQIFFTEKTARGDIRKGKIIKELAIEIMEPLTAPELKDLADQQALNRSIAA